MTPHPQRNRPLTRILDTIWHVASAPLTFVILAVLVAATLALAATIPQQPVGLTASAAESWLATASANYRTAGAFLEAAGAFTILSGVWLRVLLAALGFHLALRFADRARDLRRRTPPSLLPVHGLPSAEARVPGPLAAVITRAAAALGLHFPIVLTENDPARAQIYAERRRASAWASVLALAGALLALTGLLVDGMLGWRSPELALAPGGSMVLNERTAGRAMLQEAGGTDAAPQTRILLTGSRGARAQWIGFAWPARLGNLWVAQRATGLALAVTATDTAGNALLLQELVAGGTVSETLHVLFQQTEGEQAIALPARNLALRAVAYPALPDQGITRPVILVEAFRGTDPVPVASDFVETEATLAIEDTRITLRRSSYVVLAASYLPGLWLLLAGAALLLGGIVWRIGWGPERAWVDLAADRDMVGIAVRVAAHADARNRAEYLLAVCTASASLEAADAG